MKYNNHLNYSKRKSFILKVRIVLVVLIVLVCAIGYVFYLKYFSDNAQNTEASTTSQKTTSYVAPSISIFKSPFFQFQASNTWVEVPTESTPNKFLYRSLRNGLIEHELTVYVNQIPSNLQPTRVLPVVTTNGTTLEKKDVSEPCGSALSKDAQIKDVQTVSVKGVTFTCYGKISAYNVIVGRVGGDTNVTLRRPDNTTAVYGIYYRDLRATQGSIEIDQIVSTFQTR